jgi:hypothetical protein
MSGECMRARPSFSIMEISDPERMTVLNKCRSGASVAIIVGAEYYKLWNRSLSDVELVPAFPKGTFTPMAQSLARDGTLGPAFNDLSPDQKKYTKRFPVYKQENKNGWVIITGIYLYQGIYIKAFEKTDRKIIVVELLDDTDYSGKEIIQDNCLAQLLRVINYAHDCGGKRVVFLNNTKFSDEEMLSKIKDAIPEREKERTLARIDALLFSPELEVPEQAEEKTTSAAAVCADSPHRLFSSPIDTMRQIYDDYLIENRHESPELQEAYYRRFCLILRN